MFRRENRRIPRPRLTHRCFNPLPPCSGGRTAHQPHLWHIHVVSIRSRLVQAGERLTDALGHIPIGVSIRSRLVQAGEPPTFLQLFISYCFNPLPPCSGGRTHRPRMRGRPHPRFNPLPPCSGGRTSSSPVSGCCLPRFNPLPPCSGGRTSIMDCTSVTMSVSIRSRLVQAGEQ